MFSIQGGGHQGSLHGPVPAGFEVQGRDDDPEHVAVDNDQGVVFLAGLGAVAALLGPALDEEALPGVGIADQFVVEVARGEHQGEMPPADGHEGAEPLNSSGWMEAVHQGIVKSVCPDLLDEVLGIHVEVLEEEAAGYGGHGYPGGSLESFWQFGRGCGEPTDRLEGLLDLIVAVGLRLPDTEEDDLLKGLVAVPGEPEDLDGLKLIGEEAGNAGIQPEFPNEVNEVPLGVELSEAGLEEVEIEPFRRLVQAGADGEVVRG